MKGVSLTKEKAGKKNRSWLILELRPNRDFRAVRWCEVAFLQITERFDVEIANFQNA